MNATIQQLNQQFAIDNHLVFAAGPGELPTATVRNAHASAEVCLLGAHVLSFQPRHQEPVLWMSDQSFFEAGKAIRGGIPICWPWFAGHPTDRSKPSHGFVRLALWQVLSSRITANDATQIEFVCENRPETEALWPHAFRLHCIVTVGAELTVELISHNTGTDTFFYTGALHSYFHVSNASHISILGLDGCDYLDKTDAMQQKTQRGPVRIDSATDRIYLDTEAECTIEDPGLGRTIHIAKQGSHSTVVWNPWIQGAKRLPDLPDDGYPGMVCVETAKAAGDVAKVPPGREHRLQARIWVEQL